MTTINDTPIKDSEIFDSSILRAYEYPRFFIGDSITYKEADYKVLGFNRTCLGLCYVLETEYGRIKWLIEQVDKCFKLKPMLTKSEQFIKEHKVAVDYNNGTTTPMLSISNAYKAVALAEYNLATELLKLHESARITVLEKIVYNFEKGK